MNAATPNPIYLSTLDTLTTMLLVGEKVTVGQARVFRNSTSPVARYPFTLALTPWRRSRYQKAEEAANAFIHAVGLKEVGAVARDWESEIAKPEQDAPPAPAPASQPKPESPYGRILRLEALLPDEAQALSVSPFGDREPLLPDEYQALGLDPFGCTDGGF